MERKSPSSGASVPVRWRALAAEREAVNHLVAQSKEIRQRLLAIISEAKARLGLPPEANIDIHLPTGLWFRVGDPMPTIATIEEGAKARREGPSSIEEGPTAVSSP